MTDPNHGIPMTEVYSSNVHSVGHDPVRSLMHIRFHSGDTYEVADFSGDDHVRFMAADSKGRHFNQHIRGRYAVRKLA